MASSAQPVPLHRAPPDPDRFRSGLAGAVALHLMLAGALAAAALYGHSHTDRWGEHATAVGAIQASMVSAIPLPPKAPPVEKSVLAADDTTPAPKPPPKEATQPPPRPTDVLIKAKEAAKTPPKVAPIPTPAPPKHPQPTPATPKAASGDVATQLPSATNQTHNGTATLTVENRTFGDRYAYYLKIVGRVASQNYAEQTIDPAASRSKSVLLAFDIDRDGAPSNLHILTHSGSASLDAAAMRAIQLVDSFGPLPAGNSITIQYKFDCCSTP